MPPPNLCQSGSKSNGGLEPKRKYSACAEHGLAPRKKSLQTVGHSIQSMRSRLNYNRAVPRTSWRRSSVPPGMQCTRRSRCAAEAARGGSSRAGCHRGGRARGLRKGIAAVNHAQFLEVRFEPSSTPGKTRSSAPSSSSSLPKYVDLVLATADDSRLQLGQPADGPATGRPSYPPVLGVRRSVRGAARDRTVLPVRSRALLHLMPSRRRGKPSAGFPFHAQTYTTEPREETQL